MVPFQISRRIGCSGYGVLILQSFLDSRSTDEAAREEKSVV
jgi:hypothetical protein